jgi:hypothetical protein
MMKYCEYKKLVWPWQGSSLAIGIHRTCHQAILDEAAKDPEMRRLMRDELHSLKCAHNIHVA